MAEKVYVANQETLLDVQQTVNEAKATMGDLTDPAGEGSLVGLIKNIPEAVPTGAVKSVQSGIIPYTSEIASKDYTVEISNVNPKKCMVLVFVNGVAGHDKAYGTGAVLKLLSETSFVISLSTRVQELSNSIVSWQVIEFY